MRAADASPARRVILYLPAVSLRGESRKRWVRLAASVRGRKRFTIRPRRRTVSAALRLSASRTEIRTPGPSGRRRRPGGRGRRTRSGHRLRAARSRPPGGNPLSLRRTGRGGYRESRLARGCGSRPRSTRARGAAAASGASAPAGKALHAASAADPTARGLAPDLDGDRTHRDGPKQDSEPRPPGRAPTERKARPARRRRVRPEHRDLLGSRAVDPVHAQGRAGQEPDSLGLGVRAPGGRVAPLVGRQGVARGHERLEHARCTRPECAARRRRPAAVDAGGRALHRVSERHREVGVDVSGRSRSRMRCPAGSATLSNMVGMRPRRPSPGRRCRVGEVPTRRP